MTKRGRPSKGGRSVTFRLSPRVDALLSDLAADFGCDRTAWLEHAVMKGAGVRCPDGCPVCG